MAGLVAMQLKQKRLKHATTKVDLDFDDEDKSDTLQTTTNYPCQQRNYEVRISVSGCLISSKCLLQKLASPHVCLKCWMLNIYHPLHL